MKTTTRKFFNTRNYSLTEYYVILIEKMVITIELNHFDKIYEEMKLKRASTEKEAETLFETTCNELLKNNEEV